jgi:hypothetical protein
MATYCEGVMAEFSINTSSDKISFP